MSEQVHRLSEGEDKAEAARGALWKLRSEGVDIRVKQVSGDNYNISDVLA